MANQIVVSAGAKVRNLSGVLTATSGVVSFLPIDVSLGIPQLDVNGKILVSQLPNSVMEYKGTWNAATNTPTLANGTGNQGDVYLCNVAGTVDFGAGPIVFFVGDQVIYSGSIWQRASGATGTVTSVAVTESGDSLNITGSPITTSGTINIGFNGTNLQYVNGAGNLTTFPDLTGFVPYTGATANVNIGTHSFIANNGTYNSEMSPSLFGVENAAGTIFGLLEYNKLTLTNSTGAGSIMEVNAQGLIFPDASVQISSYTDAKARLALSLTTTGTSGVATYNNTTGVFNIPDYGSALTGYVTLATTQTITGAKTFSAYTTFTSTVDITSGLTFSNSGFTLLLQPPTLSVNRTVTLPNGTGTLALTSDISYPVTSVFGRTGAVVATIGDYTTAQVTEVTNLYFTDSRARLALSFVAGSGAYNSTTGVITIPTNNNQITNGAGYTTNVGTVTSVAATGSTGISITGSPITTSGTITITNTAPDQTVALTASTGISVTGTYPNFTITNTSPSSGGTVTSVAALTIGTTGTDLSSSVATSTTTPVITLNVPTASATNRGALSSADWSTFNSKQGTITLTTTGTSGAATFTSNTLNIPQYQGVLTNPVTGTGTTNYLPKFTGTSTIGNSVIQESSSNIGIGISPVNKLDANGTIRAMGYDGGGTGAGLELFYLGGISYVSSQDRGTSGYVPLYIRSSATSFTNGNVLIGTTTDAGYKLDVNGTGRFSGDVLFNSAVQLGASSYIYGSVANGFRVLNNANTVALLTITNAGAATFSSSVTAAGKVTATGGNYIYALEANAGTTSGQSYGLKVTGGTTSTDDAMVVYNAAASSTLFRIAGNGNVGIGTSSPSAVDITLNVKGITGATNASIVAESFDATKFVMLYSGVGGGDMPSIIYAGDLRFGNGTKSTSSYAEAMRITSGGNVLIGTTTNATGLLQVNGTIYATGFYESSDIRFKNIIETNPNVNVLGIDVIKFTRKDNDINQVRYGYSAQQVQSILPDAVTGTDFLNVNYLDVHTLKIAQLEKEIKELKAKLK